MSYEDVHSARPLPAYPVQGAGHGFETVTDPRQLRLLLQRAVDPGRSTVSMILPDGPEEAVGPVGPVGLTPGRDHPHWMPGCRAAPLIPGARHRVLWRHSARFRQAGGPGDPAGSGSGSTVGVHGVHGVAPNAEAGAWGGPRSQAGSAVEPASLEARTLEVLPPAVCVLDRTLAVLPGPARATVVRDPAVVAALAAGFDVLWLLGRPVPAGVSARETAAVSAEIDTAIMRLLASGKKDETIAKQLGVSLRTCRRRISAMLDQLGAQSRFQAGYLARQYDGLPPGSARQVHALRLARETAGATGAGGSGSVAPRPPQPAGPYRNRSVPLRVAAPRAAVPDPARTQRAWGPAADTGAR